MIKLLGKIGKFSLRGTKRYERRRGGRGGGRSPFNHLSNLPTQSYGKHVVGEREGRKGGKEKGAISSGFFIEERRENINWGWTSSS